jgi:hypothetical protein
MAEDMYCKVYVDGAADLADLKDHMAAAAGKAAELRTIRTPVLEIDLFDQRKQALAHSPSGSPDDFVRWSNYLEIEAAHEAVAFDDFVVAVASLLRGMRARGLRVVASCDFEDRLAAA